MIGSVSGKTWCGNEVPYHCPIPCSCGDCPNCRFDLAVRTMIMPMEQVRGFDTLEGHYWCKKCNEMVGFPVDVKGIYRWAKDGTFEEVHHKCTRS